MMRILLLSHFYPPETHGGTQSYVASLARELLRRGHEPLVIAGAAGDGRAGEVERTEEDGVSVLRVFRDLATERLSGDVGSPAILARIDEVARAFAPDLAHLHHWTALSRGLVPRLKALTPRVYVTLHDLFTSCARHFRMPDNRNFCSRDVSFADCARCIHPDLANLSLETLEAGLRERFAAFQEELGLTDGVFTVSDAQRDFLYSLPDFGFRGLQTLPLGTLPMTPPAAPAPLPGRIRIVNWAGLDPRKGLQILVAAVAGSARRDAFEIHIHGRSGEAGFMDELKRLGQGLDLHFHGAFEDRDRPGFAARHDLAVFPFLAFETYGLVVDEALHLGLPVIVSAHGAPPERVGERGLAVAAGDPEKLRLALEELLDAPERLSRMRAAPHAARSLADHFDWLMTIFEQT